MSEDMLQTIVYFSWFIAIILELKTIRHILEEINEELKKRLEQLAIEPQESSGEK